MYPIAEARRHGLKTDWKTYRRPCRPLSGSRYSSDYPLAEIARLIDWTPFFQTWELTGRYPAILQDEVVGEAARNLFDDAQAMLAQIIEEKWLAAQSRVRLVPCQQRRRRRRDLCGRIAHENRRRLSTFCGSRPSSRWTAESVPGRLRGAQGIGRARLHRRFCGDRRHRHRRARCRHSRASTTTTTPSCSRRWPTGWRKPSPNSCTGACAGNSGVMRKRRSLEHRGTDRRKVSRHPPCAGLSRLPGPYRERAVVRTAERAGQRRHHADGIIRHVADRGGSGFYFSHPESQYFAVAKIDRDQVEDYARRKGMSVQEIESWLAPNLSYEPDAKIREPDERFSFARAPAQVPG